VFGVTQKPSSVRVDGNAAGSKYDASAKTVTVEVPRGVRDWKIDVSR